MLVTGNELLEPALYKLNYKLQSAGIDRLDLRICGGFAAAKWTGYFTRDIDSAKRLTSEVKELIKDVSFDLYGTDLDQDWLNDDWAVFIRKYPLYPKVKVDWEDEPILKLSNLSVTFATLDSLIAMKMAAILSRCKEKDIRDIKGLYKAKGDIHLFIHALRSHGFDEESIEDSISTLYAYEVISAEDYKHAMRNTSNRR